VADVVEHVGEFLELAAVLGDSHVPLYIVLRKVLKGEHSALNGVVQEKAADRLLQRVGGGAALEDHGAKIRG
jgi:hypothetical protein